jgi:glycerate kinase
MKAELHSGIDIVLAALGLELIIADADLVITGEGRLDSQTINGKVPVGVARLAKRHGKPVIAITGSLSPDVAIVYKHGIDSAFSAVNRVCTLHEAFDFAASNIKLTARNIAALLQIGHSLNR